ncbi:helicase DnaB [Staphylococcus agnetis]|uniref:Helicase DnaB n=2 Tax=Staphylococcus agnetis TaxID=985762 RepID=A0ABX3Z292_9STAP|nr:helicase DnaB [Staphylococcus agnetis]OSP25014.1 helicase DnaB [Staphylococcus agnetis]OTW31039.1 helicase DnaB [Staphylococcus agnetis]PTH15097.1 helicase DnaB [Staphylococcus agnetis]PTH29592.1 helicase DnaB [Staphylococcus agnetis]
MNNMVSMYPNQLQAHDGFVVVRAYFYHQRHQEVLHRLFIPLIGADAVSYYQYLEQFASSTFDDGYTHYTIMSELKINLLKFREKLDLLEGIGLLKTYVRHTKQTTQFVYELVAPPSPYKFFNDPMLSVYFYQVVGQSRFHEIKRYFIPNEMDLKAFTEVTKKFTDVFKVPQQSHRPNAGALNEQSYNGVDLSDVYFDFDLLKDMLQTHYVSSEVISEPNKTTIIQLATLYRLSPDMMKTAILKSLNSDQTLSLSTLRKTAQDYYLIENQQELPALTPSNSGETTNAIQNPLKADVSNWDEWYEMMDNTSPIVMLTSWGDAEPTPQQKAMIEDLITREKLSFGAINVLLQYVLLTKDQNLPKNYVLSVASSWKKQQVTDARSAHELAQKIKEKQSQHYSKPRASQYRNKQHLQSLEKTPRWLTHPEEFELKKEDEAHLEKEKQAFLNKLKNKKRAGEKE